MGEAGNERHTADEPPRQSSFLYLPFPGSLSLDVKFTLYCMFLLTSDTRGAQARKSAEAFEKQKRKEGFSVTRLHPGQEYPV
jgi:hypothetical protein